ncbi:MAG: malate/lactate/ureidoglycolate dehydrogenase [Planctomycetaceae bacterium]
MNSSDGLLFSVETLTDFAASLLIAANVPDHEAQMVAESLVGSDLRGHASHGVVRIPDYVRQLQAGELVADVELDVFNETASLIAADARFGFGQVQMPALIERLESKARAQGVACGTLRNCGHVGRLGEWVEKVAELGLAGLIAVNDNGVLQCVAPPGGKSPRISTNPIGIAVPSENGPIVLDISTSAVANGKIKVAHLSGQECPAGWLLDSEGNPTTDPAVRFSDPRGTILPMGGEQGYKGFGLGMLFDMLVGGLSGGYCPPAPENAHGTNNVLMLVWDPAKFSGREHFLSEVGDLERYVRDTPRKPDSESIRLPGDRSRGLIQKHLKEGIPLQLGTWQSLVQLAETWKLPVPSRESS